MVAAEQIKIALPYLIDQDQIPNDLGGHSQWPQFTIPALSVPGCMFGANFVILAHFCDEL